MTALLLVLALLLGGGAGFALGVYHEAVNPTPEWVPEWVRRAARAIRLWARRP